ncbi:MAG: hypothetical protein KDD92_10480 [Caldilineaceae bacterium]|nr:hypothetical protein [Caldilineaceae bacterium]
MFSSISEVRTSYRVLILAAIIAALFTLLPPLRATLADNLWSLRFVRASQPQSLPAPPPSHPDARRWLAEQAGIQGQVFGAAEQLQELAAEGVPFSERSLGHMLAAQGDLAGALALWEQEGDYNSIETWAKRAEGEGNIEGAYLAYRAGYRVDPLRGANLLSSFLLRQDQPGEAARVLRDMLESSAPDSVRAAWLRQLGSIYEKEENWDAATGMYETLLELPGQRMPAYLALANLAYARDGNLEQAEGYLAQARAAAPNDSQPFYETGQLLTRAQQPQTADVWYREAVLREPTSLRYSLAYAGNARRTDANEISLARYLATASNFPAESNVFYELAEAYRLVDQPAAGLAAMDRALALEPNPPARYRLREAILAEAAGDTERARMAYSATLTLEPTNRTAQQGLERTQP